MDDVFAEQMFEAMYNKNHERLLQWEGDVPPWVAQYHCQMPTYFDRRLSSFLAFAAMQKELAVGFFRMPQCAAKDAEVAENRRVLEARFPKYKWHVACDSAGPDGHVVVRDVNGIDRHLLLEIGNCSGMRTWKRIFQVGIVRWPYNVPYVTYCYWRGDYLQECKNDALGYAWESLFVASGGELGCRRRA